MTAMLDQLASAALYTLILNLAFWCGFAAHWGLVRFLDSSPKIEDNHCCGDAGDCRR